MKKIIKAVLSILLISTLSSCNSKTYDYSSYKRVIDGSIGIWILCWRINEYEWRCGAVTMLNRNPDYEEILYMQTKAPCTLSEMKRILQNKEIIEHADAYEVPYPMDIYSFWDYHCNFWDYQRSGYGTNLDFTKYLYIYSQLGLQINYDYLEKLQNKLISESEK